ncbi:hypothetical protein D3C72_1382220 [compost metagenome]
MGRYCPIQAGPLVKRGRLNQLAGKWCLQLAMRMRQPGGDKHIDLPLAKAIVNGRMVALRHLDVMAKLLEHGLYHGARGHVEGEVDLAHRDGRGGMRMDRAEAATKGQCDTKRFPEAFQHSIFPFTSHWRPSGLASCTRVTRSVSLDRGLNSTVA